VLGTSAAIVFLIYIYFAFHRYFIGDDFPQLLEQSDHSWRKILLPIGYHFRPMFRMHLTLTQVFGWNPVWMNLLSVLVHLFASTCLFLAVKRHLNRDVALVAVLVFFAQYSFNEAVIWISAIQVVYCLAFVSLAVSTSGKKKRMVFLWIVMASFCHEFWLILPIYFWFFEKGRKTCFSFSLLNVGIQMVLIRIFAIPVSAYNPVDSVFEFFRHLVHYLHKAIWPFSSGFPPWGVVLLAAAWVIISLYLFKTSSQTRFPLILYFGPALIILLSRYIPSRYFYFPIAGLSILLSQGIYSRFRPVNLFCLGIVLYSSILSPFVQIIDQRHYRAYSQEYRQLILKETGLNAVKPGDVVLLQNHESRSIPEEYSQKFLAERRPKLLFSRKGSIGGLIHLKDYVHFILLAHNLRAVPCEECRNARIIRIGSGPFVSQYRFRVVRMN